MKIDLYTHKRSTIQKPRLARPLRRAAFGLSTTTGFPATHDPLHATHEPAHGATEGGGDGVNEDDFAVFDAEVMGVRSARKLGEHLDRADGFVDNVAADVGVAGAGGGGAAGWRIAFRLGGLPNH